MSLLIWFALSYFGSKIWTKGGCYYKGELKSPAMQVKADLDPMTRDMDCWGFERNLVRIMKNIDISLSKLYMNFKFILDYSPLNADPLFLNDETIILVGHAPNINSL